MFETPITICGNVIDAPNQHRFESGSTVTNFRLASTARRYDKASGTWTDGETLFLRVNCWRVLGDNVVASVVRGDPVVVSGKLTSRQYEFDGQRRTSYEVEATSVGLDLAKGQCGAFVRKRSSPAANAVPDTNWGLDDGTAPDRTSELVGAGAPG